jgi:hypothetical protein
MGAYMFGFISDHHANARVVFGLIALVILCATVLWTTRAEALELTRESWRDHSLYWITTAALLGVGGIFLYLSLGIVWVGVATAAILVLVLGLIIWRRRL